VRSGHQDWLEQALRRTIALLGTAAGAARRCAETARLREEKGHAARFEALARDLDARAGAFTDELAQRQRRW
jgi:hypothetical protein